MGYGNGVFGAGVGFGFILFVLCLVFGGIFLIFYLTRSYWQWYLSLHEIKAGLSEIKTNTNSGSDSQLSSKLDNLIQKLSTNERLHQQYISEARRIQELLSNIRNNPDQSSTSIKQLEYQLRDLSQQNQQLNESSTRQTRKMFQQSVKTSQSTMKIQLQLKQIKSEIKSSFRRIKRPPLDSSKRKVRTE